MFGMPNPVMGELVHAAVVLRRVGETITGTLPRPADLVAWCRARLAAYKVQREFTSSRTYSVECRTVEVSRLMFPLLKVELHVSLELTCYLR